jgi:hypothetical protein
MSSRELSPTDDGDDGLKPATVPGANDPRPALIAAYEAVARRDDGPPQAWLEGAQ